ncbi:serine protease FAM111B-like [Acipenser ruthenus]|uniref:serine protease FAM111B-like n=1 Tax=Acipenser ruthenus TaxID=7906 RepID=UPI00274241CD|nr:serine protease FAM111B-like [Acipenser ruthenus]XP_058874881.1 serine protease FAM111B-like [Acipenser ruthenus]
MASPKKKASSSCGLDVKSEAEDKTPNQAVDPSSPARRTRSQTENIKSFTIYLPDNSQYKINGLAGQTVLEALNSNSKFNARNLAERKKNNKKEVLITGKNVLKGIVPHHLPCSFIPNGELFNVTFILSGEGDDGERDFYPEKSRDAERVVFYVEPRGKVNVAKKTILKNHHLHQLRENLCVYAFRGETVKEALTRDGRFLSAVFEKNYQLSCNGTLVEFHLYVDDEDGKIFTMIVSSEVRPVSEQLHPKIGMSSQTTGIDQYAGTATGASAATGDTQPVSKATGAFKTTGDTQSGSQSSTNTNHRVYLPIPDTREVYKALKSQMDGLIKLMKARGKETTGSLPISELLRTEFGKNTDSFTLVSTVRTLTELTESVCFINAVDKVATGFLLFGNYILTCAHVVEKILAESQPVRLAAAVSVNFKFEKPGESFETLAVKPQIVAYDRKLDYALLELDQGSAPLPPALITRLGVPPTSGGVCIIGHPSGDVKKIDPCSVIKFEERQDKKKRHIEENEESKCRVQVITRYSFEELRDEKRLSYDTCFYDGASGSPVLNDKLQLVAMHTGGYLYQLSTKKKQSVIEFGTHMTVILKNVLHHKAAAGPLLQELFCVDSENPERLAVLKMLVEDACRIPVAREILKQSVTNDLQRYELLKGMTDRSSLLDELLNECDEENRMELD